ncbi:hypothetical protein DAEQUDRAFT_490610 [Daedalea quercina L-15889]|uniref:Uncharacterized protein n=1 Tax=Daedalea quercina L-15889 TaxID=1314783 RepID=A0A165MP68_9APHY|nr:hypothetical protein DAEQUDRAFT_490610 [Daedalea quercina L-15889]
MNYIERKARQKKRPDKYLRRATDQTNWLHPDRRTLSAHLAPSPNMPKVDPEHHRRRGSRRERQATLASEIHIPLPLFHPSPDARDIIQATVLARPRYGRGRGLTWTVNEAPEEPLQKGRYVILRTETEATGIGRISVVTDLRRHWVTFAIAGATLPCNIRVPIPWAVLDNLESYTHRTYYFNLPPDPRPHEALRHDPKFDKEDHVNPYYTEDTEDEAGAECEEMEERVARITNYWGQA